MLNTRQRKAFLKKRIAALEFLAHDSLFEESRKRFKTELRDARHCLKDKHYL